ncbi:MAG: flagellar basal body rod C-terminal domain-containing protein, partial [Elstera sp.]
VDQAQIGPPSYPFGRLATTPNNNSGTVTNPTYLDITRTGATLQLGVNFNIGDTLTFNNGATARIEAVDVNTASGNLRFKVTALSGGFTVASPANQNITLINGVALGGAAANVTGIDDGFRLFANVDITHYTSTTGAYEFRDAAASISLHAGLDPSKGGNAGLLALANDPFTKNLAKTLSDTFTAVQSIGQSIGGVSSGSYSYASYAKSMVSQNAIVASKTKADSDFQTEFVRSLQSQAAELEGVNVDEEMANLVTYQNAYSASARVVTTINQMFDTLLGIGA